MGEAPAAGTMDLDTIRSRMSELNRIHTNYSHISDSNPLDPRNLFQEFSHHLQVTPTAPIPIFLHFPPFSLPFLIISLLLLLFSSWLLNTEQSESDFIPVLWCGVIGGRRFGCVPFLFSLQKISGFSSWKQNFLFSQSQQKKMAVKMFSVVASFWKNKLKSSNAANWGLMCWIVFDWSIWYACFRTNSWFGCLKTC